MTSRRPVPENPRSPKSSAALRVICSRTSVPRSPSPPAMTAIIWASSAPGLLDRAEEGAQTAEDPRGGAGAGPPGGRAGACPRRPGGRPPTGGKRDAGRQRLPTASMRLRPRELVLPALDEGQDLLAAGDVAGGGPWDAAGPPQRPVVGPAAQRPRPGAELHGLALAAERALGDLGPDGTQIAAGRPGEHGVAVLAGHQVGVVERGDEAGPGRWVVDLQGLWVGGRVNALLPLRRRRKPTSAESSPSAAPRPSVHAAATRPRPSRP